MRDNEIAPNQPMVICTSDPDYSAVAFSELKRAIPGAEIRAELAPGVMLLQSHAAFHQVYELVRERCLFVRHLAPVEVIVPLNAVGQAVEALCEVALQRFAGRLDAAQSFSVQTRILAACGLKPFAINTALADALTLASGAALDIRQPSQVLSVALAEYRGYLTGFIGFSQACENLSAWAGGARRFARDDGQISRAEFKLLEALEAFTISLSEGGLAADLGAAPGGWTRVLRQRGLRVVAVDPAMLHPSLAADRGIRHERILAELFLKRCTERYDLLVNDMRMDARDSARVTADYAVRLVPGGQAVMTLKLPERYQPNILDHALSILSERYTVIGARQLFHNRNEVTVALCRL